MGRRRVDATGGGIRNFYCQPIDPKAKITLFPSHDMADLNNVEFNLIEIQGRLDTIYRQVGLARERQGVIRRGPYEYPRDGVFENTKGFNDE